MTDDDNETVGATFFRCALQVNPAHYAKNFQGHDHYLNDENYVDSILEKCCENDIKAIAVTDHNAVDSVDLFTRKAKPLGITVFPGFEIESREGVHVLCLYQPDIASDKLGKFLSNIVNYKEGKTQNNSQPFMELLNIVKGQGGQTIAAHVTFDKGLLKILTGTAGIKAWQDPNLLCVQIPRSIDEIEDNYKNIIKNINPEYKREHAASESLAVAVVNASDVKKPEDLDSPTATCLIKMEKPTIEGLRQAFLDPSSRIRLNSEKEKKPTIVFKEISWKGGLLDSHKFVFNKNLNTIIGGRGSGKSTIIESLRYVLDLKPNVPDMKKVHDGIVDNVLKKGTQVTLQVQVNFPQEQKYWIQATIPNKSNITFFNAPKNILQQKPKDMFPNLQVFGQHEISEFTRNPSALTKLLKSFVATSSISDIKKRKEQIKNSLTESSQDIVNFTKEKNKLEIEVSELKRNEEKLNIFDKEKIETKHKKKIQSIEEEKILKVTFEKIEVFKELIELMKEKIPSDLEYLKEFNPTDETIASDKIKIIQALENIENKVRDSIKEIDKVKESSLKNLNELRNEWQRRFDIVDSSYSTTLRKMQEDEEDFNITDKFMEIRKKIISTKHFPEKLEKSITLLSKAEGERVNLISAWNKINAEEFREISATAEKISKELEHRVRVEIKYSSTSECLLKLFKDNLNGVKAVDIMKRLNSMEGFSPSDFANHGRIGAKELMSNYSLTENQANHLANAGDCFWRSVEEIELSITTIIKLNISHDKNKPSWKELKDISTGQKATALLSLLLLDSQTPLIIDQPEDDLDNRFIADTIVPLIKKGKFSRQMIFATHNANIPVLGDAELVIGMPSNIEDDNERETKGALDSDDVRQMVEEVLEGGKQAFERRRKKYGF